jgi:hypothetical protein
MIHAIDVQAKMNANAKMRLIMIFSLNDLPMDEEAIDLPKVRCCRRELSSCKQMTYAPGGRQTRVTVDACAAAATLERRAYSRFAR